ncbi:hypothetical protein HS99_0004300 [Kitasatospora aureofaciens]|uniref:Uncharacterized protein n=1 Tax=Kitasatospora aureofaciens TaxID=1894 RepID=A0A1E7N8N0_KITAU|nr:hypothetical protein B6264_24700 [Kitasatospora aureofaciens]OEV37055.1 hypothetical protein HS99_0004300 [Kitasatospora aureofaciens]
MGEGQAGDGCDLQSPDLVAAVGGGAGTGHERDVPPGQLLQLRVEGRVVGLDQGERSRLGHRRPAHAEIRAVQ